MHLDKELLAMIWLGLGYLFVVGGFVAQQQIQNEVVTAFAASGHDINEHAGYYSQSIYYVGYALSALFTAPLITALGPRVGLILSSIVVLVYLSTFLFLNEYVMYIVSFFSGAALGMMRSSRGHYLACISTPQLLDRNASVFWFTYFMWQPLGAAFLYAVLYDQTNMTYARIRLIYGLLMCASVIGLLCFWLLLPPVVAKHRTRALTHYQEEQAAQRGRLYRYGRYALYENVKMVRLAITKEGLCLIPVFLNMGIQMTLSSSVYPTALGFVDRLDLNGPTLIALYNLCSGAGAICIAPVIGWWSKRAGRAPIYVLAMALAIITYLLIFINLPETATLRHTDDCGFITPNRALAMVCSVLMGVYASMVVNTNSAMLAALYPGDESAQAYSWAAFIQTAFSVVISLYSAQLLLGWQLLIAVLLAVISTSFNIALEWRAQANPNGLHFD